MYMCMYMYVYVCVYVAPKSKEDAPNNTKLGSSGHQRNSMIMKERRQSAPHKRRSSLNHNNNNQETRFVKDDINNDELRELRKSLAGMKVATNFAAKYLIEMQGDATKLPTTTPTTITSSTNTSSSSTPSNHRNNSDLRSTSLPGRVTDTTMTKPEQSLRQAVRRISIKGSTNLPNSSQPTPSSSDRPSLKESFVNMFQNSVRHIDVVGMAGGQKRANHRRFTAAHSTYQHTESNETLPDIEEHDSLEMKSSTNLQSSSTTTTTASSSQSKPSDLYSPPSQKFNESFNVTESIADLNYFYDE